LGWVSRNAWALEAPAQKQVEAELECVLAAARVAIGRQAEGEARAHEADRGLLDLERGLQAVLVRTGALGAHVLGVRDTGRSDAGSARPSAWRCRGRHPRPW
jgi:hypothetical protein